jgi:hypothetical protein
MCKKDEEAKKCNEKEPECMRGRRKNDSEGKEGLRKGRQQHQEY